MPSNVRPTTILLLLSVAACAGNDGVIADSASAEGILGDGKPLRTSLVRMMNAVPEMSGLNVTSQDRSVFSGLLFGDVTQYQEVEEELKHLRLRGSGRDTTLDIDGGIEPDGSRYTVVAMPREDSAARLRVFKDEPDRDTTHAQLRVIHAARSIGKFDVLLQGKSEPVFDDVKFDSDADFEAVDAVRSTIVIRSSNGRSLARHPITLERGHAYTVIVTAHNGVVDVVTIDDRAAMPADTSGKGG